MRSLWLTALIGLVSMLGCSLLDLGGLDGESGSQSGTGASASSAVTASTTTGATTTSAATASTSSSDASSSSAASTTGSGEVYADVVMADQPAAYFRLNDAGPGAFDEVSQTMRGTAVGAVGFGFNGAFEPESGKGIVMYQPGAIEVSELSGLDWSGGQAYTVEAWINIAEEDQVPGTVGRILTREIDGAPAPSGWFLGISIATSNADFSDLTWERRPVFDAPASIMATGITTEGARHLVGRYVDGQLALFIDGALSISLPAIGDLAASGPIRIGAGPKLAAPYAGQIDEVAFYDYALSDAQIAHHFDAATD